MNMLKPKFSVLMANCNNGRYIAEAIESVIKQTFQDWELVIIDDGSTDNSVKIISPFLKDQRIRLVRGDKNIGYIRTLKKLIKESKAEILGILDSDDALTKDILAEICKAYQEHPECGFIYSQFVFCDKDLNSIKNGYCKFMPKGQSNLLDLYTVAFRTFKKSDYYKTSGYDDEILYAEDVDIILKLEEVTKFYFVDKILYKYRRAPNSQTTDSVKVEISRASCSLAKYKAYLRRINTNMPNLTSKEISYILLDAIPSCIKAKDKKRVKFFLLSALRLCPLNFQGYAMILFRIIKFPFYRVYRRIKANCDLLYGA